jgi:hypothetical protein
MTDPEPTHPTFEWRDSTYYLVKDLTEDTCHGCVFEHQDSDDCPTRSTERICYTPNAAGGIIAGTGHIFIEATPEALAEYIAKRINPEEDA